MSYLMLDKGVPDFSKAVISFWFRVPQESLDKARMNFDSSKSLSLKNGIIPLVVMGKLGTGQVPYKRKYQSSDQSTWDQLLWFNLSGNYIAGPWELNGLNLDCSWQPLPNNPYPTYYPNNPLVVTEPAPQTDPTYIGVDYSGNLYVSFQTAQAPDTVGWLWYVDSVTPGEEVNAISDLGGTAQYDGVIQGSGGSGPNDPFIYYSEQFYFFKNRVKTYAPGGHNIVLPKEHWVDLNGVATGIIGNNGAQQITADKWHHVLISVDLATISSRGAVDNLEPIPPSVPLSNFVSGASKLYIAVDDVNYTQWDLSSWWVWGAGNNDVVTKEAADTAGGLPATDDRGNFLPTSTYTLTNPIVPTSDQAIGIPATSKFVDSIYKVEMAEFLMWTDVVLDTGIEKNRRLFITAPDKNGKQYPVNSTPIYIPMTKTAVGDPATWDWDSAPDTPAFVPPLSSLDPSAVPSAVKFPGNDKPIAADIDFTRCCINWQMGRNLGKLEGKVVKTGKIKAYSPDPSIGG